jgi:predicted AAA+ superfamily ATPase
MWKSKITLTNLTTEEIESLKLLLEKFKKQNKEVIIEMDNLFDKKERLKEG